MKWCNNLRPDLISRFGSVFSTAVLGHDNRWSDDLCYYTTQKPNSKLYSGVKLREKVKYQVKYTYNRSWWPRGLRRRSESRFIAGIAGSNPTVCLLCLLCVVYVAASATGWSLVQRRSTGCVVSNLCDLETSTMRRPGLQLGCCAQKTSMLFIFIQQLG
jgi:hypothetical protein